MATETERLEYLRLDCLRLAAQNTDGYRPPAEVVGRAQMYIDFVMSSRLAKPHGALAKLRVEDALAAIGADRARRWDILAEALVGIVEMDCREGMTDAIFVERALGLAREALAKARGRQQGEGGSSSE